MGRQRKYGTATRGGPDSQYHGQLKFKISLYYTTYIQTKIKIEILTQSVLRQPTMLGLNKCKENS